MGSSTTTGPPPVEAEISLLLVDEENLLPLLLLLEARRPLRQRAAADFSFTDFRLIFQPGLAASSPVVTVSGQRRCLSRRTAFALRRRARRPSSSWPGLDPAGTDRDLWLGPELGGRDRHRLRPSIASRPRESASAPQTAPPSAPRRAREGQGSGRRQGAALLVPGKQQTASCLCSRFGEWPVTARLAPLPALGTQQTARARLEGRPRGARRGEGSDRIADRWTSGSRP